MHGSREHEKMKKYDKKHMKSNKKDKTRMQAEHMSSVYAKGSKSSKRSY